ncbi:Hypothetical protein PHPALM_11650 [Phytophthora palmivora]|uniref:Retroviral polymerase SH3-like domain-containing protein n=1 Tax=Phytophthora palmivora TaxID=4796 RepID=A0A2P4Y1R1_9STRA|nr:Hypothetical protein PHPALM_11650 [Phytophthora palmivora]
MTPSSKTEGRIPYELWYRHIPSMTYTKVFGCSAYIHITEQYRDKLDARARLCMYLGMLDHKKGVKEDEFPPLADLTFNSDPTPTLQKNQLANITGSRTCPSSSCRHCTCNYSCADLAPAMTPSANPTAAAKFDSSSPPAIKRSHLTNDDEEITLKSEEDQQEQKQRRQLLYTLLAIRYVTEPPTYRVTMKTAQVKRTEDSHKPIGFAVKYTATAEIDCFKARLVIKSFLQEHGIDYIKIFAPVIK